ncbi:MAG: hypothetical protein M1829_003875 [Trizodia sp. TS-e1964]|nr:MAG: hypothetical protein M1829_003875 [Trizodia sp. TS-e1964]
MSKNGTRIPYLVPPPGVKSNFDNPENHILQMHVAGIALLTTTMTFVLLRLCTRAFITRSFGWDDVFCVISALLVIMVVTAAIKLSKLGVGVHLWDLAVGEWDLQGFIAWNNVAYIGYLAAMGFTKISVLLFYRRIFTVGSTFKYFLWATTFFVVGILVSGELSLFLGCQPISHRFDSNYPRVCINLTAHIDAMSYLDIAADIILVILPLPLILKLKLSKRDKAALIAIFTTGVFVCGTGIARLWIIDSSRDAADFTWTNSGSLWSNIECCVALICCCAPTLKPLMRHIFPNGISTKSSGRSSSRLPSFLARYRNARASDKEESGDNSQIQRASEMELGAAGHNTSLISSLSSKGSPGLSSHLKSNASSDNLSPDEVGINKSVSVSVEHYNTPSKAG